MFLEHLSHWLLYGELIDADNEFFIQRSLSDNPLERSKVTENEQGETIDKTKVMVSAIY